MYFISDINFHIDKKKILSNINFHVEEGDFIGILGPNGSGKSTLLKILLNYLKKDNGNIFLKNKTIEEYSQKNIAKIVSFVPQKSKLTMPISVKDFILLGRLPHRKNFLHNYNKNDVEVVLKIMKLLEIETFKNRDINSLSGGEFQRVLMARALSQEPEILILDEATAAMDINYSIKLMNIAEHLIEKKKLTVISVLHDLNLASLYCNKIIFLKEGKVKYFGKVEELFKPKILEEIYGFKCHVVNNHYNKPSIIPLKGELNV